MTFGGVISLWRLKANSIACDAQSESSPMFCQRAAATDPADPARSLDHEDLARREVDQPVGRAAAQPVVRRGRAHAAQDERVTSVALDEFARRGPAWSWMDSLAMTDGFEPGVAVPKAWSPACWAIIDGSCRSCRAISTCFSDTA